MLAKSATINMHIKTNMHRHVIENKKTCSRLRCLIILQKENGDSLLKHFIKYNILKSTKNYETTNKKK